MGVKRMRTAKPSQWADKDIRRWHNVACEVAERDIKEKDKPMAFIGITMKTKHPTRFTSGVCRICGEWVEMITQDHAHRHGFKNADEMAKQGVIR